MRLSMITTLILYQHLATGAPPLPPYEVIQFINEPGIYFERIGHLQQTKATWKLAIRIDVAALKSRHQQLQRYLENTEELSKYATGDAKNKCQIALQINKRENDKTTRAIEHLQTIYKSPASKRGLINAIGEISKTLFGTMDAEDAKTINEQLQLLNNQQETLQHAAKNQLKIINSTLGHMEKLEHTLSHNENLLANVTRKLHDQFIHREEIDEQLILITAMIADLTTDINDITDYLTYAKNNILITRVLPMENIIAELKEATVHLARGLNFPFKIQIGNWNTIQKYIDVSAYYDKANVYTILAFPIVAYPIYDIIKITPIPIHYNHNVFTLLEPSHALLGINRENHNYLILKDSELNRCKRETTIVVCDQNFPVYRITENAPSEVQLFIETPKYRENRRQRHILSNVTFWIALTEPQTWLFSTPKKSEITIQCNELPENKIKIEKTGKITLRKNCKLTTPDIFLETNNRIYIKQIQMYLPEFNATNTLEESIILDNRLDSEREIKLEPVIRNPSELIKLSLSLDEIKREVENNQPSVFSAFTNKNIIYPIGSATVIVTVVSIIVIIIYVIKKKRE
ncbi:uncharacterized protein [Temnothorax nylanderi]|uniref:uncharacterized protein n=1 Tax=Temnothorax nylanderi TaxID=102681 RepID=UPI003A8A4666